MPALGYNLWLEEPQPLGLAVEFDKISVSIFRRPRPV